MKATTHTEVYRPFEGSPLQHPLRPWVLALSAWKVGFKKKLPALLLYGPVAIFAIISCFRVYLGYVGLEILEGQALAGPMLQEVLGKGLDNVVNCLQGSMVFGLLVVGWYGSGLIAEDARLGANLLIFSRPITRSHYILGKLLAVAGFGSLATVLPTLVICVMAGFASPEWAFLKEEWLSILTAVVYSLFLVASLSLFILAISSLCKRKSYALNASIGLILLTGAVGGVLEELLGDERFELLAVMTNFDRLANWMILGEAARGPGILASTMVIFALWVASLFILAHRVRKLEVVA